MTRKQVQLLLEQLNTELQQEIETSQANLKSARSIVTKLENLSRKANEILLKLEDPNEGVNARLETSSKAVQTIGETVTEAQDSMTVIKEKLAEVENNVSIMEAAYVSFLATKAKIDDPDTGADALLVAAKKYKAQVQASASSAATVEAKIASILTTIQANVVDIDTAYTDFKSMKARVDDPDTGFDALLDSSQSIKDDLTALSKDGQTLYAEISRYKDQASKNARGIQAIKDESSDALEQIKQNELESEETKERISKIFELVSQSGHANYFDQRRKRLVFASWGWLLAAIIGVIVAVLVADHLLLPLFRVSVETVEGIETVVRPKDIDLGMLILRAFLVTPFVAFAVFAFNQYSKERRLAEQYAFKAVSASTIEGSIALIERSLKSVPSSHLNTQLADFAIQTAHSLHAEPQELRKLSRYKFSGGNKLANVGAEINETLEDISKDIKEVVKTKKEIET